MKEMKRTIVEKIYAGWLAKIIGIRLGAPVEGWSYQQIKDIYGAIEEYPVDYRDFAADDDSNGPLFFLRALEDGDGWADMTPQDVAEALLNYAPFEHGFFWWGGYGISTEHTAYLNLRNGISAPRSGSVEQNGRMIAEQIGGQIFVDTWGLAAPGNPDLAASLAQRAASVTHGGNGVYGGMFVAACISCAFVEQDIKKIITKGLTYIPEDSEYAQVVKKVMEFYDAHPDSWEECFQYIHDHYGYDKYPGVCHIIPNTAVMILALLYGGGEFSKTLNICNRCGWDTDCNVGNIAVIMGVRGGLEAIDYNKWRKPMNDLLICSSVVGSFNIMDIPYGAAYIAKLAAKLMGETLPQPYRFIIENRIDSCHFEYPGSTHAVRVRTLHQHESEMYAVPEVNIMNTDEAAASGERSLKVTLNRMAPGENILVYKKTYYRPEDFHDSRYDPAFSPLVYPGQVIHGSAMLPAYGTGDVSVSLYVHEMRENRICQGEIQKLEKESWRTLSYKIPAMEGALIDEMGFCFHIGGERGAEKKITVLADDLYADGCPDYSIDLARENVEKWTLVHNEISQFTRLKGLLYLEDSQLQLSASDFAEVYTGHHDWTDYRADFTITPVTGEKHLANVRVQGAIRSYAAGFLPDGKAGILKHFADGYRLLAVKDFPWESKKTYTIGIEAVSNQLKLYINGTEFMEYQDADHPYLHGGIGITELEGSRVSLQSVKVSPAK